MENMSGQKALGLFLTILGIIFFIALMGDLLFRVIGGALSLALINYGLQKQGLPSLFVYIANLFNFKR